MASVILAHIHNEPLDTILYSEVMYDKEKEVSAEPQMSEFVREKLMPQFISWGYKLEILHSDKDYLDVFNHRIERPRKVLEHKGMKYGFTLSRNCSVKRDCKTKQVFKYLNEIKRSGEDYTQYIGIALDEPLRLKSLHKNSDCVSLLEKYGYTEQMAYDLCKEYDLLAPTYDYQSACRSGCWFCPNAKLHEHKYIKDNYPDVWASYVALEDEPNLAFNKWNCFATESLHERDLQI